MNTKYFEQHRVQHELGHWCKEDGDLMEHWSESKKGCIDAGISCLLKKVNSNWELA